MVRLGEPVGKQDQYIAAFGNVTALEIAPDGSVSVEPVAVRDEVLDDLQSNLVIFYSGSERPAKVVLGEQQRRFQSGDASALEGMHRIKELGREVKRLLETGDIDVYGEILHEHWKRKRGLASSMTDASIDEIYELAQKAGAIGGKLMGAGGGGFFMFYVRPEDRRRVRETLAARGLKPLRFRFDMDGARIVSHI